ncbi:MAG: hypothetical protein J0L99_02775 [Chitinophagales bacterium]|nr:hypothetical protein [Chitinophagales bacterium]
MKTIQKLIALPAFIGLMLAGMLSTGCQKEKEVETPKVSSLEITLRTGGDDLRQGSEALGTVGFENGSNTSISLNNGANWGNNSTNTVTMTLPPNTEESSLSWFRINFTSGSNGFLDTGDNWNLDQVKITARLSDGSSRIMTERSAEPLVRFTKNEVREYTVTF